MKQRIKVQLPEWMVEWLRAEAIRRGCSEAQVIRDALQVAIDATRRAP